MLLHQEDEPIDKHTHVRFLFTDGTELHYKDVRKFGTMHLFKKGEELNQMPLADLGPEPFDAELTPQYLQERLQKTNRKIKVVLLDQHLLVGLGNIYVDEVLFRSQIHPEREAASLTEEEIERIYEAIVTTLGEAVKRAEVQLDRILIHKDKLVRSKELLNVYGKKGEQCVTCGTLLEKTVVGGRGTHYCPICQPRI